MTKSPLARERSVPRTFKRESAYEREERQCWKRVEAVEDPTGLAVVEGVLMRGEVRAIVGAPKRGKTCFAAQLGVAVSQGEAFLGRATRRTNVLYVAAEESPVEWALGAGKLLPQTDRWFRVVFGCPPLDVAEGLCALRARTELGAVGLVVVDPLWAVTAGGDPRKALAGLRRLCREKDAAGLVVHHERMEGLRELEWGRL